MSPLHPVVIEALVDAGPVSFASQPSQLLSESSHLLSRARSSVKGDSCACLLPSVSPTPSIGQQNDCLLPPPFTILLSIGQAKASGAFILMHNSK